MDMRNFLDSLNESTINKLTEEAGPMQGKSASDLFAAPAKWRYWPDKAYADNSVRIVIEEEGPDAWKIYSLSQKAAGAAKSGAASRLAARTKGKAEMEAESRDIQRLMNLGSLNEEAGGMSSNSKNEGSPDKFAGWSVQGVSKTYKFAELLEECVNIVQNDGSGSQVVNLAK